MHNENVMENLPDQQRNLNITIFNSTNYSYFIKK